PQHCLYFLPLPHGLGSFGPTLGPVRTGLLRETASLASLTESDASGCTVAGVVVCPPEALVSGCSVRCGSVRRKFSKSMRLLALRKMLRQISVFIVTMSSSNILKASALYSISGSRWP